MAESACRFSIYGVCLHLNNSDLCAASHAVMEAQKEAPTSKSPAVDEDRMKDVVESVMNTARILIHEPCKDWGAEERIKSN
jgi:hypothetical protein